ncbi:MerR family transcriptional regulator [Nonomuraea lactucae]|uniref:MerR family transcriptional regulator n=1 Tax=Nonomuraea lactucae TaxID=2249762 RepID=UPI000DE4DEA8|nr:MerR family DNA-binding transcriptional regulator [Nonomuraea lactucae]
MRITEAAQRLGMSPRMLRYREALGLLPPVREQGAHRRFGPDELAAVAQGVDLEKRFDVSPAALAFALRVLSEPAVAAAVRELGVRIGRIQVPRRALDFEKEKALRLLRAPGSAPASGPGSPAPDRRTSAPGRTSKKA